MADEATRRVVAELPLLRTNAGPRDRELWVQRLKEEYQALIKYVENNKNADNDWFRLESNKEGTRWFGKCWYIHDLLKYEFALEFDIPVTYPSTAPEIAIPELDGKTAKMYRLWEESQLLVDAAASGVEHGRCCSKHRKAAP
ncbi:ubiquitin-fold modifier-conjugating enzyme 1 isoform X2 [Natator depressus]|uniref:ubiquitin-fold modifier-conjugating enzyme 1 isoform X2 n=1 Tax=Natator depressus TaxID=27790 RepID=UPI003EB97388